MLQVGAGQSARDDRAVDGAADLTRRQAALEASGDVFYEWDLTTDCLKLAGRAARLFGADAAELPAQGAALDRWVHPEDQPRRQLIAQADAESLDRNQFDGLLGAGAVAVHAFVFDTERLTSASR